MTWLDTCQVDALPDGAPPLPKPLASALRAALAEDAAPDTVASAAAPDASAEDRDALAALRVPELKDRCRARGLRVGGTKAVLIDRLLGVEE